MTDDARRMNRTVTLSASAPTVMRDTPSAFNSTRKPTYLAVMGLLLAGAVAGCSDSSGTAVAVTDTLTAPVTQTDATSNTGDAAAPVTATPNTTEADTSASNNASDSGDTTAISDVDSGVDTNANSGTDTVTDLGTDTAPVSNEPPASTNTTPVNNTPAVITATPQTDTDLSGGDDDSPTLAESLSLQGPFIKDTTRSAGPPSTPEGLTLLLASDNWMEFSWVPSSDDQSVEAYEIYRDDLLVHTIRGDSGYEFDYRSWISTSFIDCNYTRYASCEGQQPTPGSTHQYTIVAVDNEGVRSAPSEPVSFTFETVTGGTVDLTGYSLVFNEEFDGTGLDRSRWKTSLPWGPDEVINRELQYFVNTFGANPPDYDPFVFNGETLTITGDRTPDSLADVANGQPYVSGVITTSDNFEMTYGFVEMRARVAGGTGLLSTFYLFNQDFDKNQPELDILEYLGDRPDKTYHTYHYYDSNRARYATGEKHSSPTMEHTTGTDMSAGFHNYGMLWEKDLAIWYIDGVEVKRITGPRVSDEPMNIIAHLVLGSEWIGEPDASAVPATFEIDHIRAWQR